MARSNSTTATDPAVKQVVPATVVVSDVPTEPAAPSVERMRTIDALTQQASGWRR